MKDKHNRICVKNYKSDSYIDNLKQNFKEKLNEKAIRKAKTALIAFNIGT